MNNSKTTEIKITVLEQTANLLNNTSESAGMTPGQIVDQMALNWASDNPKAVAQLILDDIATHSPNLTSEGFDIAIETVLSVIEEYYENNDKVSFKETIENLSEKIRFHKSANKKRVRELLEEMSINALKRRIAFMKSYDGKQEDLQLFVDIFVKDVCNKLEGVDLEAAVLERLFDIEEDSDWKSILKEEYSKNPVKTFGCFAYTVLERPNERYFNTELEPVRNEKLDAVYDFLQKLGYELSDEEQKLICNTCITKIGLN